MLSDSGYGKLSSLRGLKQILVKKEQVMFIYSWSDTQIYKIPEEDKENSVIIGEILTSICLELIGPDYNLGHFVIRKGKIVWHGIRRKGNKKPRYWHPNITKDLCLLQEAKELGIISE